MLLRTLRSLGEQTYRNWEALVIDDGSTDGTEARFRQGGVDPRIRYIRRPNGGVSAARNTGIREAGGDFVAFLDSDDLWRPWKLELQAKALVENPDLGMVWTDMEAIDEEDRVKRPHYLREFYTSYQWFTNETLFDEHREISFDWPASTASKRLHVGKIFSPMLTGNLVHTSTAMITKQRLATVGFFDESIRPSGEDYDFHLRTCREGTVGFLDVVSTSYRTGAADQLTKPENGIYLAEQFLRTVNAALARDANIVEPRYRRLINRAISEGHAWAAAGHLQVDQKVPARRHLIQAVRRNPPNPRAAALIVASLLPDAFAQQLRSAYRSLKGSAGATTLGWTK